MRQSSWRKRTRPDKVISQSKSLMSRIVRAISLSILCIVSFWLVSATALAATQDPKRVPISVFVRDDCKHCNDEKVFLENLKLEKDYIDVIYHDLGTIEGRGLFEKLVELERLFRVAPVTLVGSDIVQGFDTEQTTGKRIRELANSAYLSDTAAFTIKEFIDQGGSGSVEHVTGGTCDANDVCGVNAGPSEFLISIPLIGAINIYNYSLPSLSVILGFVDGFNPCAMWVLLMFLIILIEAGSRKKMWQMAGLFIFAEAVMYYLILNVWFAAWDFIGLNQIITPLVGVVAMGGGTFFLYEFWQKSAECKIVSPARMKRTKDKISALVMAEMTVLVALGIIGVAFSVNIIEFACSIGIPQAYTKIVELNAIGWLHSQALMVLYILFYMIDDIVVFAIAIYSFERLGLTTKYVKASNLIGGVLMLLLGYLLIFYPQVLIF